MHHFHNSTDFQIAVDNSKRNHVGTFSDRHVVLHAVLTSASDCKPFLREKAGLVLEIGPSVSVWTTKSLENSVFLGRAQCDLMAIACFWNARSAISVVKVFFPKAVMCVCVHVCLHVFQPVHMWIDELVLFYVLVHGSCAFVGSLDNSPFAELVSSYVQCHEASMSVLPGVFCATGAQHLSQSTFRLYVT